MKVNDWPPELAGMVTKPAAFMAAEPDQMPFAGLAPANWKVEALAQTLSVGPTVGAGTLRTITVFTSESLQVGLEETRYLIV